MVRGNDPIESFINPIQYFKEAISPIELGIKKTAKDLESCLVVHKKNVNNFELVKGNGKRSKMHILMKTNSKDCNSGQCVASEEKKKGLLSIKVPMKALLGMFSPNLEKVDLVSKKGVKAKALDKDDGCCMNCLQFAVTWPLLVNGFVQALPSLFKTGKKWVQKMGGEDKGLLSPSADGPKLKVFCELKPRELKFYCVNARKNVGISYEGPVQLECLIGFVCEQLIQNLKKLEQLVQEGDHKGFECLPSSSPPPSSQFDHLRALASIWEGQKADFNGFLGNLKFARVGGVLSSMVGETSSAGEEGEDGVISDSGEETGGSSVQKVPGGILSIPLSSVEHLRSTLSNVLLTTHTELLTQLGRSSKDHPDKKKLFSVQDFFRYAESEGTRFFEELDRDGDGQVNLEDLEIAMRNRKLPLKYAREFMRHTRSHLFSKSFGLKQFLYLMEHKEPTILRAYTSLCLSKSGTLQKNEILASLKNAGLPANDDNAVAMMRFLNADTEESISYGHFQNFMLLLPSDRLQDDPRSIWFEAATVVAVPPPVEIPAGSFLKSALAGGLSCAFSASLMHPVDTIKTLVQASTLTFPEIIAKLPQIGVGALYKGSIPAILGQFSSHGLRTGIFESSKLLLLNVAPNLPELQVQSISSFLGTFLGTVMRIPCEVLKQRLQAGLFNNVGEAIIGTWHQDGPKGFFGGTGATLCRELPFYVVGTGVYEESKKMVQQLLGRELEPWETIFVGALSGGLTAVTTTPFDVIKTRMMIAPQGRAAAMHMVAYTIIRHEGPLGLFKGAVPRFFWVAPLGAINFAGYELVKKAMDKF